MGNDGSPSWPMNRTHELLIPVMIKVGMRRKQAARERGPARWRRWAAMVEAGMSRAEVARLRQYRMLAYRDPLTGLRNRRYFDERLAEDCDRARRPEGSELSLLVIDIDEFKVINDLEGHLAGDRVLIWVANFLNKNIRTHDTCCRTGGDEFMIILSNTNREDCQRIKSRIEKNLTISTSDMPTEITLSIGAATKPCIKTNTLVPVPIPNCTR